MDGPVIMMSWHRRRPYCGASYVAVAAVLAACSCAAVWNLEEFLESRYEPLPNGRASSSCLRAAPAGAMFSGAS